MSTTSLESFSLRPERFSFGSGGVRFLLHCHHEHYRPAQKISVNSMSVCQALSE